MIILLQRLDRLLPRHARLRHHQLDVLGLHARLVDLLILVVVLLFFLGVARVDGLALAGVVRVVVARVAAGAALGVGCGELRGSVGLGLRVQVLDLGLAENAGSHRGQLPKKPVEGQLRCLHPRVACGRLVDIRVIDDEKNLAMLSFERCSASSAPAEVLVRFNGSWTGLTFFGRRRVTRVIPVTCFKPSLAMALRAFFSFLEWIWTVEPPGPAASTSGSESELLDASSTSAFFVGSSSGSSSILGLAMVGLRLAW